MDSRTQGALPATFRKLETMICRTTYRTHLTARGKPAYLDYVLAVGFGFVLTHTSNLGPTLFADTTSQRTIFHRNGGRHPLNMQVFKTQGIVAIKQISREFVQVVSTLVAYFLMQRSYHKALFIAVLAALYFTSKTTLFYPKTFQIAGKELLVIKLLPVGSDQKRLNAQPGRRAIQTYGGGRIDWFGFGAFDRHRVHGGINQNRDKIFSGWCTAYGRIFDRPFKASVQRCLHRAAAAHLHLGKNILPPSKSTFTPCGN